MRLRTFVAKKMGTKCSTNDVFENAIILASFGINYWSHMMQLYIYGIIRFQVLASRSDKRLGHIYDVTYYTFMAPYDIH